MTSTHETLNADQAVKKIRESMAFKGDFARWLIAHITTGGPARVYWTDLHPLTVPADLTYSLSGEGTLTTVRFGDSIKGERPPKETDGQTYSLSESSDCVLVLVSRRNPTGQWRLKCLASSSKQGPIVEFEASGNDQDAARLRVCIWRFKAIKPARMVAWYNPFQLARTAVDVLVSSIFGRHADYRLMEAVSTALAGTHDYTHTWEPGPNQDKEQGSVGKLRPAIWLDYVGDVGDGWNSTYAVAHYLAKPTLTIADPVDKTPLETTRGNVLVFGGDQVYPVANRIECKLRLVQPYDTALDLTDPPHPHAYAIPGNHDWYDSLVSFTRLFCQQRWFAGWQTKQTRSYFALKLPGGWWLLGTDVQLDSDIDVPQIEYFKTVAEQMQQDDRVIICTAEPHWVYAALYGKDDANINENNLAFLEKKVIGQKAKVAAFIAGDQHHYRRYATPGERKGDAAGTKLSLHCDIDIHDIYRFMEDPQHSTPITARIDFAPLGLNIPTSNAIFTVSSGGRSKNEILCLRSCFRTQRRVVLPGRQKACSRRPGLRHVGRYHHALYSVAQR